MQNFTRVSAVVATLEANYAARQARIEAAFKESNSDITPTEDSKGRFHAPCDGYMLPVRYADMCEGDYSDKIFAAGEYLPEPLVDEEHYYNRMNKIANLPVYKRKVKAPVASIEALQEMGVYRLDAAHGRAWDESGVMVAYAYLEGMKILVDAAEADLGDVYNGSKVAELEVYLEGKQTVIGELVFTKPEYSDAYGHTVKMMVKTAEGHKLYGTMPAALPDDCKGKMVTFSATFKPGKNGLTYYSRPTQAEIIEAP